MKHIFSFSNGVLQVHQNPKGKSSWIEYIHTQCNITYDPAVDVSHIEREFRGNGNCRGFVRGKYLFWFLVEFAISVHRDIARLVPSISAPPKMATSLGYSSGIVLIAPRARVPESLRSFINDTFCAYIETVNNAA
jgi:hypothetical protein